MTQPLTFFLRADGQFAAPSGFIGTTSTSTATLSSLTKLSTVDISTVTSSYVDGPSVTQGTAGVWFVTAGVSWTSNPAAFLLLRLWDGTSVIASCEGTNDVANDIAQNVLSGVITSPAGNLRISAKAVGSSGQTLKFNASGDSADCWLTAIRIG